MEFRDTLFLDELNYLSSDDRSTVQLLPIDADDSRTLSQVLAGRGLAFTLQDLEALSSVSLDSVVSDFPLSDNKKMSKTLLTDPEVWEIDRDGTIQVKIAVAGHGADFFDLKGLKDAIRQLTQKRRKKRGALSCAATSTLANSYLTDSMVLWVGTPLAVTVAAAGAHVMKRKGFFDRVPTKGVKEG